VTAAVGTPDEARGFPGFAAYMARCLYDPDFGYYSSGNVRFGSEGHFLTHPIRLHPLFGAMVAETVRPLLAALARDVPADLPLTILELGAGDGTLAADTMDHVRRHARSRRWRAVADRLRYVIGERSPALREVQAARLAEAVRSGRAEVREMDALSLYWEGPFSGIVVANELLDVAPCERLRIVGPGPEVQRIHVVPLIPDPEATGLPPGHLAGVPHCLATRARPGERAVDAEGLWTLLGSGRSSAVRIEELAVPLRVGWLDDEGCPGPVPQDLDGYIEALGPLVADLAAFGLLPVDLHWAPGFCGFLSRLSGLLRGEGRRGAALLIDYGGTSRHVLDPKAGAPHLRVFGPDRELAHRDAPYESPGRYDITWDIDFSELGRQGEAAGLTVAYYGDQGALEGWPVALDSARSLRILARERMTAGIADPDRALRSARNRVDRFRGEGFNLIAFAGRTDDSRRLARRLGPSDPFRVATLATLAPDADRNGLRRRMVEAGLPGGVLDGLKPCGDPIADLATGGHGHYRYRRKVLAILRESGALAGPGEVGPRLRACSLECGGLPPL
jgi:SAM-dependent MidA family methyltransferase